MIQIILATCCLSLLQNSLAAELRTTTPPPPPRPYQFAFVAERGPGMIDRTHAEAGDSNGVVRGQFSYIDPAQQIRTVEYTADKQGFHPIVSNPVRDTRVVAKAKLAHAQLYNQIAAQNLGYAPSFLPAETKAVEDAKLKHLRLYQNIAAQHAQLAAERKQQQQVPEEYFEQ